MSILGAFSGDSRAPDPHRNRRGISTLWEVARRWVWLHHRMVVSRVDSEGKPFWGGANKIVRLYYVCKHPHQRDAVKRWVWLHHMWSLQEMVLVDFGWCRLILIDFG